MAPTVTPSSSSSQVQEMLVLASRLGPHVLCGDFNAFQQADCSPASWAAILADAAGKGWPAPSETTAALGALATAGYRDHDCFYLSDNHRCGPHGVSQPALANATRSHPSSVSFPIPLLASRPASPLAAPSLLAPGGRTAPSPARHVPRRR